MTSAEPLWIPSPERVAASPMAQFSRKCEKLYSQKFSNFQELHAWSIEDPENFWDAIWDYCGVVGEKGISVLTDGDRIPGAQFFPKGELNFAENLLKRSGASDAIVFRGEDKIRRRLSWDDLHGLVSRFQQAFLAQDVKPGDRIAAMAPNLPETIACMLAASSIGAVWSSCSPDFGEQGVLDRFGQIEPVLFIACDGYWYNGKLIDVSEKLTAIVPKLGARKTIILPYLDKANEVAAGIESAISMQDFIGAFEERPVEFLRLSLAHPLYILFSSGTTGIPKCIVHSQGGVLLQHMKEQRLHCGIGAGDRVFWFTTCGWMMWNWLVSNLALEATVMLYDGSPFYPDGAAIFDYVQDEKFTFFGTSAKFIDAVRIEGRKPIETHDLSTVQTIASTGSPLANENFSFVYNGIKADVHLASVSGGTDIVACFVGAVPSQPVYAGEIQGPALGMAVEVWSDEGKPVRMEKGELVCVNAFPSMPIQFWNDPDGSNYHNAYFARFENVWCHGDFAEWTANGGMIIHGRSDATLNPGGVRIGTAEIYNQVEQMSGVDEALCIGQEWKDETRIVLFVRLADGFVLNEELEIKIKKKIRTGASPRHVPSVIIAVEDIPRTKSGKITELAVRDIIHGRDVKNREALANPEALELYYDLPALQS